MKKEILNKFFTILFAIAIMTMAGCNDPIYDFGYDGRISGKIIDSNNNIVSGDIKIANFAVNALGELDDVSMVMRIKGDGTYENNRLYPQLYKVWLVGPFVGGKTDTILVDLTGVKDVIEDFQVTPFLSIPAPEISGSPTSTKITVNYTISGNAGNKPNLREIYCSTVSWPTRTTGTGAGYFTKMVTVSEAQGTVTISDLSPGTKYYIRVGARAAGQNLFNHSEQIVATTPSSN